MQKNRFRTVSLALAGILIGIGGCTESPSAPAMPAAHYQFLAAPQGPLFSKSVESSAVIGPEGGVLVSSAGHRIEFPAGALAEPTEITLSANTRYAGVELEPHGLRFPAGHEPVLTINTGGADLSRFDGVDVLYVDGNNTVLDVLPTRVQGGQLQTRLQHFSGYIGPGH